MQDIYVGEIFFSSFFFLVNGMKGDETNFGEIFFFFAFLQRNFSSEISVRNRDNAILKIKTSLLQKVFFHSIFAPLKLYIERIKNAKRFSSNFFSFSFLP